MPQNKLHRAMAQPAMSIVKKIFRGRRVRFHRKSIARATRAPAAARHSPSRATSSIAIAETRRPSPLPQFPKISKLVQSANHSRS
jgi:hypothetical protein